uniref:HMG box domain-containing protein n=1 Tax=Fibrocapsa japonica TaxID=94617 RepID=A0A7S2UYP1_9STRA|mmetsp:Transcript_20361/g.29470  ORF Transcript_20361/g.29470 Transcript_20361/m.29470 type:complete len:199 (+) Transcript_20361:173-769(+)|eukprot:CAMPEP_0113939176 /NCGR_PEP_ID=MMETSP1339-20121228/5535_1 /TAXON_ID=94617 /ORGANISM="Fibrocapsa japonica" /LENGTH=198 /DNA_ID=CAMNT_0000942599 /DNA_START=63 /DNA_END=659 /DNA_ORIENTATION=+ /assembly_acc=CAM_ASM_000762
MNMDHLQYDHLQDDYPKKKRKRSHKKAPGAPKRARSPYILFASEKRAEVKARLGENCKVTDVMKAVAALWRQLDEEGRKEFVAKAEMDRARFQEEMSIYEGPLKIPNRRAKKNPNAPKRAMSAFLHFSIEYRPKLKEQNPQLTHLQISKLLGDTWNALPQETKDPYVEKSRIDNQRYRAEIATWDGEKYDGQPKLADV